LARGRLRRRMLAWQFRRSGPERKVFDMNWISLKATGSKFKVQVKAQWSRLTHDHPDVIVGKRVELAAKIQEASPETECKMKEENPPRRLVLRGALVLGCSPWVPIALVGCDSKKDAKSSSAAPAGSPATSADSAAPAATSKVSQTSVQYQAQPKGEQKCGGCVNFIAESNTCKLVAGQVSPEGWCSLWAKKA
jgi:uncharacterized protein YjbJ (UPF0337 family)